MHLEKYCQERLDELKASNKLRQISSKESQGHYIIDEAGNSLLNLSSNDYLGLAADKNLLAVFYQNCQSKLIPIGSTGSRLLGGNYPELDLLETKLAQLYNKDSALVLGTGFQLNQGLLSVLAETDTLILADRYVHASIIDGIRMSRAKFQRFRHQDYRQLEKLVAENHLLYKQIIIVEESIYSMDGDCCKLQRLIEIKKKYPDKILLYLDEAHAVGAEGSLGLGLAEQHNCIQEIDFLIGTFGKAYAAMGAFVVCKQIYKDYFVNRLRPFIFSTSISPLLTAWIDFILDRMPKLQSKRIRLKQIYQYLGSKLNELGIETAPKSQIVPLLIGDEAKALEFSSALRRRGFYALAIRYPTVEQGKARIRFSLRADFEEAELDRLVEAIGRISIELNILLATPHSQQ